jgi:hypothetical protein
LLSSNEKDHLKEWTIEQLRQNHRVGDHICFTESQHFFSIGASSSEPPRRKPSSPQLWLFRLLFYPFILISKADFLMWGFEFILATNTVWDIKRRRKKKMFWSVLLIFTSDMFLKFYLILDLHKFFFSQTTFINSEYKLFFFSRLSSYLLWTTKSGQLTVSPNIFRRPLKLFANMLTFECFSLFGLRSATKQKRTLLKKIIQIYISK